MMTSKNIAALEHILMSLLLPKLIKFITKLKETLGVHQRIITPNHHLLIFSMKNDLNYAPLAIVVKQF